MLETLPTRAERRSPRSDVLCEHLLALALLAATAVLAQRALGLSALFIVKAVAAGIVAAGLIVMLATTRLAARSFGAANRVTLARGGLVVLLVALLGEAPVAWTVVVVAGGALALDGVDGWLARKLTIASDFGARFDMETDALLLLVVTGLVLQYGKAGPWILLAGLMRYGFVALAYFVPRFARPLPERRRRKAAFVLTAMLLIVSLAPIVASPGSDVLALIALAVLGASFAIDVVYLARGRGAPAEGPL